MEKKVSAKALLRAKLDGGKILAVFCYDCNTKVEPLTPEGDYYEYNPLIRERCVNCGSMNLTMQIRCHWMDHVPFDPDGKTLW